MAGNRIKGITIEIGGDATGLDKALSGVNKQIRTTQQELRDVERLLKLDPTNTELLAQRQKLLQQAVEGTSEKLKSLKEAEKQAQEQFQRGEISEQQYNALKREIIDTEEKLNGLEDAAKKSNATMAQIGATADKVAQGAQKVSDATRAMSVAAAGVLTASAALSVQFEDSFAKVSTLLDEGQTDFAAYKQAIIAGSNETGIAVNEYAEAVYSSISASVDQADAVQFTASMAKLAKGGFTDLSKAVDVTTTVINGYGLAASEAEGITDVLVQTQNLGKTTVDELASSMGKVIPTAAAANYSFEELGAAYAQLTKNGIATAESGTYLRSMLSELTKSGSITDKALRDLSGKGFAELKAEGTSTADILNMLSDYAKRNGKSLKDMFGSVEAGSAALVLARNDGQDYIEMLNAMESSTGAAQKAFDKVSSTSGARMKKSLNEIKNAAIELGDVLAPAIEGVASVMEDVSGWMGSLSEGQLKLIAGTAAVVAAISPIAGIVSGIASAVKLVSGALSTLNVNPVVLAITAAVAVAGALGAAFVALGDDANEAATAAQSMADEISGGAEELKSSIASIDATAASAGRLIDRLDELNAGGLDDSEISEYNATLRLLCETVPELSELIDTQTGEIAGGTDALRANTAAWAQNAKQQAYQQRLTALYEKYSDTIVEAKKNEIQLADVSARLTEVQAQRAEIMESLDDISELSLQKNAKLSEQYDELSDQEIELREQKEMYTEAIQAGNEAMAEAQETIAIETEAINELTGATMTSAEAAAGSASAQSALAGAFGAAEQAAQSAATAAVQETQLSAETTEKVNALAESYANAYNSAYSNITGQVGLFDTFAAEISEDTATVEQMMARWGQQTQNLAAYTENLQKAAQYGISDGLIAQLSDGTPESEGYLQTIIDKVEELGGSEEGMSTDAAKFVAEFNKSFADTQQAKDSFATTVGTMQTDLNKALEEMVRSGELTANQMDTVGTQLINGMIEGMDRKTGDLDRAVRRIVSGAIETARTAADVHSPSKKTIKIFENVGEGMVVGIDSKKDDVSRAVRQTIDAALRLNVIGEGEVLGARLPVVDMPSMEFARPAAAASLTRSVSVTMTNTFNGYDEATGAEISRSMLREINRALGREY